MYTTKVLRFLFSIVLAIFFINNFNLLSSYQSLNIDIKPLNKLLIYKYEVYITKK